MRTQQIYWGAVPFLLIQLLMVGILIAVPQIVSIQPAAKDIPHDMKIDMPLPAGEDHEPPLSKPADNNSATKPRT